MTHEHGMVRERMQFLGQDPAKLRGIRGQHLYDTLGALGLTHAHYFRALGTNVNDYCAREFGVDLGSISVERFFQSDPNAKWLFPDLVREAVIAGLRRKPVYPQLIARDEHVSSTRYDVPYVSESETEEELRGVAEGAAIPESKITYGDRVVKLDKKGRGVIASYEVIRRMSVDVLRVHLQRIGERLGRALDRRVCEVLVHGDNSGSGTAAQIINTGTAGTWAYGDILAGFLYLTQVNYFTPTHLLAEPGAALHILSMDQFADPQRFDFARTGNLPTPLGLKLVPMADHPEDKVTILDAGFAVQKVTEQDLLVESDKLIHQQWDRTYLTIVTDFAVLYEKARIVINSDWS
jgi:hypothetical protein